MTLLREVNQRTTRLESRMVQLGDYVGANLRTRMRIEVCRPKDAGRPYIEIDALDVSISRIVSVLQEMNITEDVDVYLNKVRVATIYP
jgi:type VI protein secretion system component Hcp